MSATRTDHRCAWCRRTVIAGDQGGWTHGDGIYPCRNRQGKVLSGRYAFPKTRRWPLVTAADFPPATVDR